MVDKSEFQSSVKTIKRTAKINKRNKEKEIWLQFAVAFSVNNSEGIMYLSNPNGNSTIDNRIARRADEMLRQYKERFDE